MYMANSELPFDPIDASEVYNPADFKSFELDIFFRNNTTHTEANEGVRLLETGEKTVILELPPKCCNLQHNVMIEIYRKEQPSKNAPRNAKPQKPELLLNATGKIAECETQDDGTQRATLKLVQFEEKQWNDLVGIYEKRQEEINRFLESARG